MLLLVFWLDWHEAYAKTPQSYWKHTTDEKSRVHMYCHHICNELGKLMNHSFLYPKRYINSLDQFGNFKHTIKPPHFISSTIKYQCYWEPAEMVQSVSSCKGNSVLYGQSAKAEFFKLQEVWCFPWEVFSLLKTPKTGMWIRNINHNILQNFRDGVIAKVYCL